MHVAQSIRATATDALKRIQPLNQIANCPAAAIAAETDRTDADSDDAQWTIEAD